MIEVDWPSQHQWREARRNREYDRTENYLPIEAFTTAEERSDWIRRIEAAKEDDTTGYFAKEYDKLIDMVNGARRKYGFDVGLGDDAIRKELDDRLNQAHEAAARAFAVDPANRLPIDEEAWQDELRRRSNFEHWLETGEPIKTTNQPEVISAWNTLREMIRARESDREAVARDLVEFKSKVEWTMNGVCIDIPGCSDPKQWQRNMDAAYESIQRSAAADAAVAAYLKARGTRVLRGLYEYRY